MLITLPIFSCFVILVVYFQPRVVVRWLAQRDDRVLYFVETRSKIVALTVDDGPHHSVTPQILDVLKENSARATFFLIGSRIRGNEHLLKRMQAEGHELGNHLMTDRPSVLLSSEQFETELLQVDQMLKQFGPAKWCRPGSGWYTKGMLNQLASHNYKCVLGSVYPFDTSVRAKGILSSYIINQVYPGSIIILHDGSDDRQRTVEVLKSVLPALKEMGYEVATVSQLLSAAKAESHPGQPSAKR